jgi:adenosine kinase
MKIAICGSYAYDIIMNFHDKFKNHILPDKVHMLNVAFLVPTLRREFGGCAGNIAYNCNLLGLNSYPIATVGSDFSPYQNWLNKCEINTNFIQTLSNEYTAQAFITTDEDDNQITAFHPGAMSDAHNNSVMECLPDIAIVAPDGKFAMIKHAKDLSDNQVPFVFDPGQGLPMFDKDELITFINQASWVVVNDYEAELLKVKTGLELEQIAEKVQALIITKGEEGSEVYADGAITKIAPVKAKEVVDPTGCGDSFRAGILFGLVHNFDIIKATKLANLIGSIKVAHQGTQNHFFNLHTIKELFLAEFGEEL